ncbi:MAG: hypothetical protein NTZ16_01840 [Verrucomicrobia bacterium]|nr:hypothetical protein [Verrucomicrobiota bacterium]
MFSFVALCLLLTACDWRDAKLHKQIAGTWRIGDNGLITLDSDGRYQSRWTRVSNNIITKEWMYEGTWAVKSGFVITTITKNGGLNNTNSLPAGTVERFKIIQVNANHLATEGYGQTNVFERKH